MSDTFGIGSAVQGATSLAGTALQVSEEDKAMHAEQTAAANSAANLGKAGEVAQSYYSPYVAGGANAENALSSNLPLYSNINNGFTNQAEGADNQALGASTLANARATSLAQNGISEATLQATPGYQWNLQQGENAATNSAAARGLANSGAALKGASTYASGLADSTYQNQFNDAVTGINTLNSTAVGLGNDASNYLSTNTANQGNITNAFNRTNSLASTGLTAAAGSAGNALAAAGDSNAYSNSAAGAVGAGSVGIANAASSGLNSLGNSASQYSLYNQLLNGGGGSGSDFGSAGANSGF
jgi:hypothetical protein